jgi:hypothetical protein
VIVSDAIMWDRVEEELIRSCSLSLGCDCVILLVFSYLLDVNQRISRNTVYKSGDVNDN